jgi:hypothetical protein
MLAENRNPGEMLCYPENVHQAKRKQPELGQVGARRGEISRTAAERVWGQSRKVSEVHLGQTQDFFFFCISLGLFNFTFSG